MKKSMVSLLGFVALVAMFASQSVHATSPVLRRITVNCSGGTASLDITSYNMDVQESSIWAWTPNSGSAEIKATGYLDLRGTGVLFFKNVSGSLRLSRDYYGRLFATLNAFGLSAPIWCQNLRID